MTVPGEQFIAVEQYDRVSFEVETDGLLMFIQKLDENVSDEDGRGRTAYSYKEVTGDGEENHGVLYLFNDENPIEQLRRIARSHLETVEFKENSYALMNRYQERLRLLRSMPLVQVQQNGSDEYIATVKDLTITFTRNREAPAYRNGQQAVTFNFESNSGSFRGSVEVVGDKNLTYEFMDLAEGHYRVLTARQQYAREAFMREEAKRSING